MDGLNRNLGEIEDLANKKAGNQIENKLGIRTDSLQHITDFQAALTAIVNNAIKQVPQDFGDIDFKNLVMSGSNL